MAVVNNNVKPKNETNRNKPTNEPRTENREKKAPRAIKPELVVSVKSVANGKTKFVGAKGYPEFAWSGPGESVRMTYQELCDMRNQKPMYFTVPWLIVENEDVRANHKDLQKAYDTFYHMDSLDWLKAGNIAAVERKLSLVPDALLGTFITAVKEMVCNNTLTDVLVLRAIEKRTGVKVEEFIDQG